MIDDKTTSFSFEVGLEQTEAFVQVDLCAIVDEDDEFYCAVFKLLFGDHKKFNQVFEEWREKFSWAWNCTA